MTLLFILGIGLPILAASTGDRCEKRKCRKELYNPDPAEKSRCKKKEEAEKGEKQASSEKKEKETLQGKANSEKAKENPGNTSFNFLYYLFYKSSNNDFFQKSECQGPGRNP